MKLRTRYKTKTMLIDVDNSATFDYLLSSVQSMFRLGTDIILSLNNHTPIEGSAGQTLTDLGIVSGDLIYVLSGKSLSLDPSSSSLVAISSNSTKNGCVSDSSDCATISSSDCLTVDSVTRGMSEQTTTTVQCSDEEAMSVCDKQRKDEDVTGPAPAVADAAAAEDDVTKTKQEDRVISVDDNFPMDTATQICIVSNSSEMEAVTRLLPCISSNSSMSIDGSLAAVPVINDCMDSDVIANSVQVNHYLNEPIVICEATEACLPQTLVLALSLVRPSNQQAQLLVALDVLMSELGYQRTPADEAVDWHMTKGATRLNYIYPQLTGVEFQLQCVPMCNLLIVHGFVHLAGNSVERKQLMLKVMDYVNSNPTTDDATAIYKATKLAQLSRLFKDTIAYPLLQLAFKENDMGGVPDLETIIYELKIHIFKYLDVRSLVRVSSVCRHLYDVAHQPLLWRRLYIKDFSTRSDMSLSQDWITLYKVMYAERKKQREQMEDMFDDITPSLPPFFNRPFPPYPSSPFLPLRPPVGGFTIGGEYDLWPSGIAGTAFISDHLRLPCPPGPGSLVNPPSPPFDLFQPTLDLQPPTFMQPAVARNRRSNNCSQSVAFSMRFL